MVDQGGRDPDTSKVIKGRRRHHQLNAGRFAWACILKKAYCSQASISKAYLNYAQKKKNSVGEPSRSKARHISSNQSLLKHMAIPLNPHRTSRGQQESYAT